MTSSPRRTIKSLKKKSNYLATDELYKTLEESANLAAEAGSDPDKGPDNDNSAEGPSGSGSAGSSSVAKPLEFGIRFSGETVDDEDEWSDYTEENRFNYTSVPRNNWKTLSCTLLAPSVGGEVKAQEPEQSGGDGLDVGHGKRQEEGLGSATCPWQKLVKKQPHQDPIEPKVEQQPEKSKNPETKPQVYIPPALRQSQGDCRQRPQVEKGPCKLPSAMPMAKPQAPISRARSTSPAWAAPSCRSAHPSNLRVPGAISVTIFPVQIYGDQLFGSPETSCAPIKNMATSHSWHGFLVNKFALNRPISITRLFGCSPVGR